MVIINQVFYNFVKHIDIVTDLFYYQNNSP